MLMNYEDKENLKSCIEGDCLKMNKIKLECKLKIRLTRLPGGIKVIENL